MPGQRMQINTPRFTDAQRGPISGRNGSVRARASQSPHRVWDRDGWRTLQLAIGAEPVGLLLEHLVENGLVSLILLLGTPTHGVVCVCGTENQKTKNHKDNNNAVESTGHGSLTTQQQQQQHTTG